MFIATITGKVGKVDEVRTVGESKVKNFSVAHNFKRGDEWDTVWYECALWGSRAEALDFAPGDTVTVATNQAITANIYMAKDPENAKKKIPAASLKVYVDQIHVTRKAAQEG
jgi:hypothetical protein